MQTEAIMLHSQDGEWEGLYINGKCVEQGHHLGEGNAEKFWLDIGAEHRITGEDLIVKEISNEDEEDLYNSGCFPDILDEMKGNYRN